MKKRSKRSVVPVGDSLMIHCPNAYRGRLLITLATMPDEAFGWFVVWASGGMMQFPEGLGGFMPESRAAITELRAAATAFMELKQR